MNLRKCAAAALLLVGLGATGAASAATLSIVGGATRVKLSSLDMFASLGLDLGLIGSATISGSTVRFPVTGGTIDELTGFANIEHDGSGISISDGLSLVTLENFVIDTEELLLSGLVGVDGTAVGILPIFNLTTKLDVTLTSEAAGALSDVFGLDIPAGFKIGSATVNLKTEPIPVPAALWLMISGLAGLGGLRRLRT